MSKYNINIYLRLFVFTLVIFILVIMASGCQALSFMECGDRGVCKRTGFLWHHPICLGDKECK
jgi:hypothetical protein